MILSNNEQHVNELELQFIGDTYKDFNLPPEKQYLYKYFHKEEYKIFINYNYMTGRYDEKFSLHTGYTLINRDKYKILQKIKELEDLMEECNKNITIENLEIISQIKSGKYKLHTI